METSPSTASSRRRRMYTSFLTQPGCLEVQLVRYDYSSLYVTDAPTRLARRLGIGDAVVIGLAR